jgi:hypothetical protein
MVEEKVIKTIVVELIEFGNCGHEIKVSEVLSGTAPTRTNYWW